MLKQLSAGMVIALLFAIFTIQLGAQPASEARPGHGFGPVYDAAHEITINGTVHEVVTKHALGSPAGMHLLVSQGEGTIDAHVGAFLTKDVQEALHTGLPVQIVGAMQEIHGKQYLLARQLIFGGRLVAVRNERGFLVHNVAKRTRATVKVSEHEVNGGAR
jgi:hypothetical protein